MGKSVKEGRRDTYIHICIYQLVCLNSLIAIIRVSYQELDFWISGKVALLLIIF